MESKVVELKVNNYVGEMLPRDAQLAIEYKYAKKHIDKYIKTELLESPDIMKRVNLGVELLEEYISKPYHESKTNRVNQLKPLDLEQLILSILVGIGYQRGEELFTSVVGKTATRLNMSDKLDGIKTVSEILAVLIPMHLFKIYKEDRFESLKLVSLIQYDPKTEAYIDNASFLPPMVCEPELVTENYQSGHLTYNDSVILKDNHHSDEIALDVINLLNQTALELDGTFLSTCEEMPTFDLDSIDKISNWNQFKKESIEMYALILKHKCFYETHSFDKRGRVYAKGYHINSIGTAYKKAMINFYEKELIEVPGEFK